jgi:hypothetical protein
MQQSTIAVVRIEIHEQVTAMDEKNLTPQREELLRLRARIVVLERASLAALELALRMRPEELETALTIARSRLHEAYEDTTFSPDIADPTERLFLAAEVEKLMLALQSELGFAGGIQQPESG